MALEVGYIAVLAEAQEVSEIVVIAEGTVEMANDEPLFVDKASAERCIAAFDDQGVQVPIDFEHSTVYKGSNAEKATAAGWIKSLKWQSGRGLVASVEWTDEALAHIKAKEYKYLSPVVFFDTETREPYKLHSMALTNKPATKHQRELLAASARLLGEPVMAKDKTVASDKGKKDVNTGVAIAQEGDMGGGTIMELAAVLAKAGVEFDATNEAAVMQAAIAFIKEKSGGGGEEAPAEEAPAVASEVLSLLGAKDGNEAVLKLKAEFVPRVDYTAMSARLKTLEKRDADRDVEATIAALIDQNKINPGDVDQMKACRAMAEKDLAGFSEFMAAQSPYVAPGRLTDGPVPKGDSRNDVIVAAAREFQGWPDTAQALSSESAHVNQALRDAFPKLKERAVLTDDEITKHGIAAG